MATRSDVRALSDPIMQLPPKKGSSISPPTGEFLCDLTFFLNSHFSQRTAHTLSFIQDTCVYGRTSSATATHAHVRWRVV